MSRSAEAPLSFDIFSLDYYTRSLAYTTVLTVMNRLVDKGLLLQNKTGRAHLYRPAMSREAYAAQSAGQIIRSL
jgi:predicted transcriptional regulator